VPVIRVAWFNVENLYESERYRGRDLRLRQRLGGELAGWTSALVREKVARVAGVIASMFDGRGPDVIALAEVENDAVLKRLVTQLAGLGQRFEIVHHDSADARGIDLAFLYRKSRLTPVSTRAYVVQRRNPTRDIFSVQFKTRGGAEFYMVANHWPARESGQYDTEPFRIMCGEAASVVVENIYWREQQAHGARAVPSIVMVGDFNDTPWNRSLIEYLLASGQRERVLAARNRMLFNLCWSLLDQPYPGTYVFDSAWLMVDQALVNAPLLDATRPLHLVEGSLQVHRHPDALLNGRPRRFGRPAAGLDRKGVSDHLPLTLELQEA
jgi:predicted extracellular nuclease